MSGRTNIKGTKGYDPDYAKQIHKKNIESAGASGQGFYNAEMGQEFAKDLKNILEPHVTALKNEIDPIWKNNSASPGSSEFVSQLNRTSSIFAVRSGQIKADLDAYLEENGLKDSTDLEAVQKAKNEFLTKYASTYGVPSETFDKKSKTSNVKATTGSVDIQSISKTPPIDASALKDQVFVNTDAVMSKSGDFSKLVNTNIKKATGNLSFDEIGSKIGNFAETGTASISNLLGDIKNPDSQIGGMITKTLGKVESLSTNFDANMFNKNIPNMPDLKSLVPKGASNVNISNAVYKTTVGNNVVSVTEVKSVIADTGKTLGSVSKSSGKVFDI
tara:strand:+ start:315 stop:1307 length:993 start_codon:yes stop_codon:yes gene_type:complete